MNISPALSWMSKIFSPQIAKRTYKSFPQNDTITKIEYLSCNCSIFLISLLRFLQITLISLSLINCILVFESVFYSVSDINVSALQDQSNPKTSFDLVAILFKFYRFLDQTDNQYINATKEIFETVNYIHYIVCFCMIFILSFLRRKIIKREVLSIDIDKNTIEYHIYNDINVMLYPSFTESVFTTSNDTNESTTTRTATRTVTRTINTLNVRFFVQEYIHYCTVKYVLCLASQKTLAFPSLSHTHPQLRSILSHQLHSPETSPLSTVLKDFVDFCEDTGDNSNRLSQITHSDLIFNDTHRDNPRQFCNDNNLFIYPLFRDHGLRLADIEAYYTEINDILTSMQDKMAKTD